MAFYKNNKKRVFGTTIIVKDNDINKAISMLRHISAPIIKEYKEKQAYEKPSERKRREKKESIRKFKKKLRMQEF